MRPEFDDNKVPDVVPAEPQRLKKLILKLRWIGLYPDVDLMNVPPPWQHEALPEMQAERR